MSSCRKTVCAAILLVSVTLAHAQQTAYSGVGRAATAKELAAWDIDVRPDFKGLPKGSGTVAAGMEVWETKCSSCHGIFGESNQFFSPLVGGTTKEDIKTGHVARLNDRSFPGRTTLMKAPTVSTLWDYINRAMPWNAPKSLSVDEVYAVLAYMLNMGSILPESFTLSDRNIAEVQQLMPNRKGMTTDHAMWPGAAFGNLKPDVKAVACMKDCSAAPIVASSLPDFARDAHGNLAEQNRLVGAQHGANTDQPAPTTLPSAMQRAALLSAAAKSLTAVPAATAAPAVSAAGSDDPAAAIALTAKYTCVACHGMENKIIGPAFREIASKHASRPDAVDYLQEKIKAGGAGVWGAIPMPPQTLSDGDAKIIARWLAAGAKK